MSESDNVISSTVQFEGKQTRTIQIDGVTYSVTNKLGSVNEFGYSKNLDTGVIEFSSNSFTITAQADKQHNILINGKGITFRGGNFDDTVVINSLSSERTVVYGGKGNDTITANKGSFVTIYGEDGDDVITTYSSGTTVYGGAGNNVYDLHQTGDAVVVQGGEGDETFNIYNSLSETNCISAYGYGGNDIFNVASSNKYAFIDGGEGTNTIYDKGSNTIKISVCDENGNDVSNKYKAVFAANETKTLTIDAKEYLIKNRSTTQQNLYYSVAAGVIEFRAGSFDIKGQADVKHNVRLSSNLNFTGGDLDDRIELIGSSNKIYGGEGNDEIILSSGFLNSIYVYGEGGNDTISITGASFSNGIIDGGDGDDTINLRGARNERIFGGAGNDTFNIYSSYNIVDCGDGDDTVNYMNASVSNNVIIGGSGNNITNGASGMNYTSDFADSSGTRVDFSTKGEKKTLVINGINYTVTNNSNGKNSLFYFYNPVTDEIIFGGSFFNIKGQEDKKHNIRFFSSDSTLTTGNLDDKIYNHFSQNYIYAGAGDDYVYDTGRFSVYIYGQDGNDTFDIVSGVSFVYGGNGDDEFFLKNTTAAYCRYYGEAGNDIYHFNVDNNVITDTEGDNIYYVDSNKNSIQGGSGKDTFYVNGSENVITGQGGDDYLVVKGDNNYVDGGSGTNLITESSATSTVINATTDPNSGEIRFSTVNEVKKLIIDGKTYTFTNQNADGTAPMSNVIKYSYNPSIKEFSLIGSDFTLSCEDDKTHNIRIQGNNNTIEGGNLNDRFTIQSGTNNILHGKNGDDTFIVDSAGNHIYGDEGNDSVTLNSGASNTRVDAGAGDDVLNIKSNNNTIDCKNGNDKVTADGSHNQIKADTGNNQVLASGTANIITAGDGNNTLSVVGANNTITAGNGKNTIGIQGDSNTAAAGNGHNTFNIYGNKNNADSGTGEDIFKINGSQNTINAGAGADNITITGNSNTANGNEDNDKFVVQSGYQNVIDGNEGIDNTLLDRGIDTIYKNVNLIEENSFKLRLQVGANEDDFIYLEISFSADDLSLDFSTEESSVANIDVIDEMMFKIRRQCANIGTVLNRLESIQYSQMMTIENYTSAVSTVIDADIAEESAKLTKSGILQQTVSALMAHTRNIDTSIVERLIR